jgi:cytochrome c-type biogenesis protein CcmH/NrfG
MGWIIALVMAAATGLVLWRFARLPRGSEGFIAAAMLVALAGYGWQARPGLPGAPRTAPDEGMSPDTPFAIERLKMLERFGTVGEWLDFADALDRMGERRAAVSALNNAISQNPGSADLYVGLGNALTVHAGGLVTPAARLAFDRAAEIAPNHPGPPFFLGLALAQAGQLDEAARVWRELLDRSPADAPYRTDLEQKLAQLDAMRAQRGGITPQ